MRAIRERRTPRRTMTITPLRAVVVLAAFAVVVAGATFAFGAIVNNGTVTACVDKATGAWRVLPTGSCGASEKSVKLYTKNGADAAFLTQTDADGLYLAKTNCVGFPHTGIDWHGCDLTRANLAAQGLNSSDLSGAILIAVEFRSVDLSTANLTGANLQVADLTEADLRHANLTDAVDMQFANLTNVHWGDTTCPDGTNSDNNGNTCIGHL